MKITLIIILIVITQYIFSVDVTVLGNESLPYNGTVNGKPSGIIVDILNEASNRGGPNFTFKLGLPWLRAQNDTKNAENKDELIAIIPFTRTEEREPQYKWIAKMLGDQNRLVSYGRDKPVESIEEARGITIGIINGHAIIPVLQSMGINNIDTGALNAERNATMLYNKRFDTICEARMVYLYNWKKIGKNVNDLQEGIQITELTYSYLAAGLNFPDDVAESIATAIQSMRDDGTFDKIVDKWTR